MEISCFLGGSGNLESSAEDVNQEKHTKQYKQKLTKQRKPEANPALAIVQGEPHFYFLSRF